MPPYGGVALQAQLLVQLMNQEGVAARLVPSNPPFPTLLGFCEDLRGVRTLLRCALFSAKMWSAARRAEVVHILACSWLYFFLVVIPAAVIGRLRGKRLVLNYRGGEARRFFRWWGWSARPVFKLATVVTAPSGFLAEVIQNRFGVPVQIVPNIVDFSLFRYRQRLTFPPRIIVARHLEAMYDIESVLEAFRVVQGRFPDASLWIAGVGSQEQHLRGLVAAWNLNGVRFLGHVAHEKLPDFYDQCNIFLNASRVDNFPGALLEASVAGLAVVSTGAGGIPFIYENGKTALLVEPGDWQGLARAVIQVVDHPSMAAGLMGAAVAMTQACEWTEVRKSLYRAYGFSPEEEEANANNVVRVVDEG
jgi:glycosyltransferase involved in cell wall biosynthesis